MKMLLFSRIMVLLILLLFPSQSHGATILFQEQFEDTNFGSRGWYDKVGAGGTITTLQHVPGSSASLECHWTVGSSACAGGTPQRIKFAPSNSVYVSFWIKHDSNWFGSMHLFYILTTEDGDFSQLASSHLDAYINEGSLTKYLPDLELQDAQNIDTSNINVDLTKVTENRASQGCNGYLDLTDDFHSCFHTSVWINERLWESSVKFDTTPGSQYDMTQWHFVEYYFQLNTITNGIGNADGVLKMWIDHNQTINKSGVSFRTGAHPSMQFDQFILSPFNSSAPADTYWWIDNLTVATAPISSNNISPSPPQNLIVK